jgi:hypothetical protein
MTGFRSIGPIGPMEDAGPMTRVTTGARAGRSDYNGEHGIGGPRGA